MEETISVVVPVYKVELYLERCVTSIRNQTFGNLEIILVDDGSPDNSGAICDELARQDPRIRVIHKPNGGLSDARNAGIEAATGAFIGFIDSDDFIHPDMFGDLYRRIALHGADIVQCSQVSVTGDEIRDPGSDHEKVMNGLEALDWINTSSGMDYVMICDKLYRKSLFDTIRFPVSKIHEDEFTSWKLFYAARRVVVCDKKYYHYFQSPVSIIRSGFSEKKLHYTEAMEERIAFYREKGLTALQSITLRRYARWLLLFMYRNREAMKRHPAIRQNLRERYAATVQEVCRDPAAGKRLRMVLKQGLTLEPLVGFLVYQNLFKKNPLSRIAGWLGLGF